MEALVRRAQVVPGPETAAGDWLRPGLGVERPEPKELPRYEYPAAARGTGRRATVRVAVLVDEAGKVVDTRVREGDGTALGFDEAATEAVRRVPFWPATRDGVPGRMWTELILTFEEPLLAPATDSAAPPV
jgi:TonB family protein